jgi:hypothetical protein
MVVALALTAAGCGTFKVVPLATNPADNAASLAAKRVAPGDTVRVVLKNGQQSEFKVRSVEDDALVGQDGQRVVYADVALLERRSISATKTTLLVLSRLIALTGAFVTAVIVGAAGGCDAGSGVRVSDKGHPGLPVASIDSRQLNTGGGDRIRTTRRESLDSKPPRPQQLVRPAVSTGPA